MVVVDVDDDDDDDDIADVVVKGVVGKNADRVFVVPVVVVIFVGDDDDGNVTLDDGDDDDNDDEGVFLIGVKFDDVVASGPDKQERGSSTSVFDKERTTLLPEDVISEFEQKVF